MDGLIDVIHATTAVTISNNYFTEHDKVRRKRFPSLALAYNFRSRSLTNLVLTGDAARTQR
jgi:hypothetical protein